LTSRAPLKYTETQRYRDDTRFAGRSGNIAVLFNHSQRVRKIAMSFFFKLKLRRTLFGDRRHGCRRDASPTPEQSTERRDWIVNRIANKLSLNAEQKPLLTALIDQANVQRQAMVGNTTDPRAELRSWFAGSSFDSDRALALINNKADTVQLKSPETLAALAAFYDHLNPAQQQRVRDFMDGRRHGWFRRC
jgi:Spy/CpxP family protein refolding chaperone